MSHADHEMLRLPYDVTADGAGVPTLTPKQLRNLARRLLHVLHRERQFHRAELRDAQQLRRCDKADLACNDLKDLIERLRGADRVIGRDLDIYVDALAAYQDVTASRSVASTVSGMDVTLPRVRMRRHPKVP